MKDECLFYTNFEYFAGNGRLVFLDSLKFRTYLNRFFKCGVTHLLEPCDSVHWVFTHEGKVYDSVAEEHQPAEIDFHCSMYSFYYELYFSRYKRVLGMSLLRKATSHRIYINNLIKIYTVLSRAFRHPEIVSYIYKYKFWKECGMFITNDRLPERAEQNVEILKRRLGRLKSGNIAPKSLF
jgi:hypothetical protein